MEFCLGHHVNPFPVTWASKAALQQEQQIITFCGKRLQKVKINTVSRSDMTGMRAVHLNKCLDWDRCQWPLLKTIFDGTYRFQGGIIIDDRFPIGEDKLIEFAPVIKKHFTTANSDMIRSLGVVAEKGLLRPGKIAPTKAKTSESSKYCVIKCKYCIPVGWPNYRYLTIRLRMAKTNHDHAVEQLVTVPVPQHSHLHSPLT